MNGLTFGSEMPKTLSVARLTFGKARAYARSRGCAVVCACVRARARARECLRVPASERVRVGAWVYALARVAHTSAPAKHVR